MQHPHLDDILAELKAEFERLYGNKLAHLVLYGSQARGDAEELSDIDVLVVLKGDFDNHDETARTSEFIAALSLKYNTVVSRLFVSEDEFHHRQSPLMINVRLEGMLFPQAIRGVAT